MRLIARDIGRARHDCGMFLLEALIALVLFSIGTVGLLGVVASALAESANARWRGEAFGLAASTLSRMWTENPADLAARYDAPSNGAGYRALLAAAMRLPGVTAANNAPAVTVDDAAAEGRKVSVTVYWQHSVERHPHHAAVSAVLPRR